MKNRMHFNPFRDMLWSEIMMSKNLDKYWLGRDVNGMV